ncbi:MAG: hypothetical protein HDQ87_02830 [Clostridia bacterium]|nr:hypothetical protein [Clostridia bacterium]
MADLTYDEINARVEKLENEFEDSLSELPGVDYALAVRIIDPLTEDEHGSSMISEDDDAAAQLIEALFDTVRDENMPLDEYVDFACEVLMNIGYNEPGFLELLRDRLPEAIEAVNEELAAEEAGEDEEE